MATERDIIERDAEWAQTFRNAPANLAQRARNTEAIAAAEDMRTQEAQAAFETRLAQDSGLRSLVLGRERLQQGQQRIGQAERRMQQQQTNFETTQERLIDRDTYQREMQTRKLALDELNEQRRMQKDLMDTRNAEMILNHTRRAEQEIGDHIFGGIRPGTKEFAERALRAIAQNPMIDPKARASILGSARILGDEEEFETAWNKLSPEQQKRATVVDDPKGWRISVAPESATDSASQLDSLRKEYDAATTKRAAMENEKGELKPGYSEDDRLFYDDQKRNIMGRIRSLNPQAVGPAAAGPVSQPNPTAQPQPQPSGTNKKLYTLDGKNIKFGAGQDLMPSVQQALEDGLISEESARSMLEKSGFKRKAK